MVHLSSHSVGSRVQNVANGLKRHADVLASTPLMEGE